MTLRGRPGSWLPVLAITSALLRSLLAALFVIPLLRFLVASFLPVFILCFATVVAGQAADPGDAAGDAASTARPENVRAVDAPNDKGDAVLVEWETSTIGEAPDGYAILRLEEGGDASAAAGWRSGDPFPPSGWQQRTSVPAGSNNYRDSGVRAGKRYTYAIAALAGGAPVHLVLAAAPAVPRVQLFHQAKGFLLLNLLGLSAAILVCVFLAARGREFPIRKIAGLEAMEEAIGRATEMGRPLLFVPGTQDMDNVQTVAGMTILGSVAQMTAHYEAQLDVPTARSLVMSTGRETVREAYAAAGRPDLYSDDIVHYVSDEQFGYVAAIDGFMVREKPAACFYMGAFFAESLILAETGNSIGAIQVAGTAQPTQLPFFVAACDYTLIGEELFAASAYLSKNPSLLGSLRGQDLGKATAMLFILVGAASETIGRMAGSGSPFLAVSGFLRRFFATNF